MTVFVELRKILFSPGKTCLNCKGLMFGCRNLVCMEVITEICSCESHKLLVYSSQSVRLYQ